MNALKPVILVLLLLVALPVISEAAAGPIACLVEDGQGRAE